MKMVNFSGHPYVDFFFICVCFFILPMADLCRIYLVKMKVYITRT